MEIEHLNFQKDLYSVALNPERLGKFAEFFNTLYEGLDGESRAEALLSEEHFLQALTVADLMIDQEVGKSKSLKNVVKHSSNPTVALNGRGQILEMNKDAERFFSLWDKNADFQKQVSLKTDTDITRCLNLLRAQPDESDINFIELIEVEIKNTNVTHLACLTPWELDGNEYALLIQVVNIQWPEHLTPLLCKTFDLTESEGKIFACLAAGDTAAEIAIKRSRSVATVRTQIREIYAKTGTTNQLQFIRLATSFAALVFENRKVQDTDIDLPRLALPYPRLEHWNLFHLKCGRLIDFAVFGNEAGTPCLFFHNELFGDIWPAVMAEYAKDQGLKIIIIARPYYRRSSAYPEDCFHPTQTAKDVKALLDHLETPKVAILSQTLGGMFALEFAHCFPERVLSFVTIAPMLPFGSDEHRRNLPYMHRFIATILLKSPKMLEFVARVGYSFYLRDGPEKYLRNAFGNLPCDQKVLNHPVYLGHLCQGLEFGSTNGYKSYLAGFQHLLHDAEEKMKNLSIPITVLIGDSDQNTRTERAQHLIDKGVDMRIEMLKEGGELLIYTHPKEIIDAVVNSLR